MLPPKDYKPIYMTSSVRLDSFLVRYRDIRKGLPADTVWDIGSEVDSATAAVVSAAKVAPAAGETKSADTSAEAPASTTRNTSPLHIHLRSVDASRYPDEVELRAHIYDTEGHFIMGLAPPHFAGSGTYRDYWRTLVDSCGSHAVRIDSFAVAEVRDNAREPHAIAFVLDHSPSMGDERTRRLQEAVRRTLGFVKAGDHIAVVKFTREIHVEVPLSGDSAVYKKLLVVDGLKGYGVGTAMYDAVRAGIDEVAKAPEECKRVVVLFSDGGDNSSSSYERDVYAYAREKRVTIYTIAYGLADEKPLHNLASFGNGRMYRIYSSREFPYVFADIYRSLKNYYRITYRPPECNGRHTVTVGATFAELGMTVMARGKYERPVFTQFDTVGSIVFANIEFEYGKAVVREESKHFIGDVANEMLLHPAMTIEIRGHTDDAGSEEYNLKLSKDRAQAVANVLMSLGVESHRLSVVGYGESRPMVPNTSPENARLNRRTEFVILSR